MRARWTVLLAVALAAVTSEVRASEKLVLYTSQPTDQMKAVLDLFKTVAPEIEVEMFRSGTTEVLNKLAAEFAAGSPRADVLLIADEIAMMQLARDNRLLPYPEAPVARFPKTFYDPQMRWFGTKVITTGIVYNTNLVKEPPKSWKDLLRPEAKGRVIMPSPLYSGAAVIHVGTLVEQPEFGWSYFEKLAEAGALSARGNGAVLDAVAKGERAYGVLIDYMALNAKAKGSPVDFVFPMEGVTAVTQPVAILATTKNPRAAKKFVDFQLSEAAQRQAVEQGYIPAMEGIAPPPYFPDPKTIKLLSVDPAVLLAKDEQNKKRFADLFGG
ncbi:MAG: ABC transporter substrate-binding protein [Geminicoccaceae bacterium]|nr:ABC transporter substrate-binding protein [Geminicoccaceae bacterium]MCX7631463.1 ABC transporter substrate-binding protein [Geminicoccaceae bacterium]MDW8124774.1 ABC transporter substrate-binding protein [Geminicoccaceae bacterium]MDW8342352.1 ABC transporter substrate-binding protein [Geminicoccaceae bacterium]